MTELNKIKNSSVAISNPSKQKAYICYNRFYMTNNDNLTVGLAQISSVWLNKTLTTKKIVATIEEAATKGCQLLVFIEAMFAGYRFLIGLADQGSGITTEGDELGLSPGNSDNPDDWSHH